MPSSEMARARPVIAGEGPPWVGPMKRSRSSSLNRRARRRPKRLAGSRPASAQRRSDASLARKNRAASRVVSSLSLIALYLIAMMSNNGRGGNQDLTFCRRTQ